MEFISVYRAKAAAVPRQLIAFTMAKFAAADYRASIDIISRCFLVVLPLMAGTGHDSFRPEMAMPAMPTPVFLY